mmetsp:Transcript_4323/g.3624  ORF Transcript_4323/g.3624 Transcript_4323/m.3624 type:complete len:84 (+) Transcript_4323:262-513(+)
MENDMKENLKMIEDMGMANLDGLMEESMKEDGKLENSTVKVFSSVKMAKKRQVNGKMEKELNGSATKNKTSICSYFAFSKSYQ